MLAMYKEITSASKVSNDEKQETEMGLKEGDAWMLTGPSRRGREGL